MIIDHKGKRVLHNHQLLISYLLKKGVLSASRNSLKFVVEFMHFSFPSFMSILYNTFLLFSVEIC